MYPWVIYSFNSVCFTRVVFRFHYYLSGKDQNMSSENRRSSII
jgi:hypothetical protein